MRSRASAARDLGELLFHLVGEHVLRRALAVERDLRRHRTVGTPRTITHSAFNGFVAAMWAVVGSSPQCAMQFAQFSQRPVPLQRRSRLLSGAERTRFGDVTRSIWF
jgi:hypothetical protein